MFSYLLGINSDFFLNSFNQLAFVMETRCIVFVVRTKYLNFGELICCFEAEIFVEITTVVSLRHLPFLIVEVPSF